MSSDRAQSLLAIEALVSLVRAEYPDDLSLAEIARRWGDGLSPDHRAALARLDSHLRAESTLCLGQKPLDVNEVETC